MAQSVARLVRNEKVRGSNPLSSTTYKGPLTRSNATCGCLCDLRQEPFHVLPVCSILPYSYLGRHV
jgi:hypothetical protein